MKLSMILAVTLAATSASLSWAAVEGFLFGHQAGIFVWKNSAAMDEGIAMIKAGVHQSNPTLVMGLLSCIAPDGSRVILTGSSMFQRSVTVIDGKSAGCRGVVSSDFFKRR
jgi:hypothetical protein